MGRTRTGRHVPSYRRLRRTTGRDLAYVALAGRRHYLGAYDTPESRQRYHRLIAEWEASGRAVAAAPHEVSVAEISCQYLKWARGYYLKHGQPTKEPVNIALAIRPLLELYRREGINPFAGIFPILLQFPILITLYQVFWRGLEDGQLKFLYGFVENPGVIDPSFLGLLNLGEQSFLIALLAGTFQFIQGKQMMSQAPKGDPKNFASAFQKQAIYLFPAVTLLIVSQLPSAIGVYWIVTSLFTIGQQWYLKKQPA